MLTLDVGSGTGSLHTARGNVCIDLCKRPQNNPPNFVCADAHHLPFKDGTFDSVGIYEVIEHVESPIQCLREIRRVLKEKATLNLTTPNVFFWRVVLKQVRDLPAVLSDTGHISCWSQVEMRNLLLNTGFTGMLFRFTTLPLVFSPHKTLDRIARFVLPAGMSERNMTVSCVKSEDRSE